MRLSITKYPSYNWGNSLRCGKTNVFDKMGYDPREAVCEWVIENFELVQSFVPPTYPRVIVQRETNQDALFLLSLAVSCCVMLAILVCLRLTYHRRKNSVMYHTQIEFMYLLEVGLIMHALAAAIRVIPTTDVSCASIPWLTNIGYILMYVPVVAKIEAI